ncbi:MAG: pantoate--beta-alanine ligase, partial [bacterium]|nr:pantoate--beta-alanine ligase [bacterium]
MGKHMKIAPSIREVKNAIKAAADSGKTIGFVPTMGYLHRGHLELVKQCRRENDFTVVSIFVNPTQFGPTEDLSRYPRDFDNDEAKLSEAGVDLIFFPSREIMYPQGYSTYVDVQELGTVLCGKSRSNHFRGVTTVVLKLFNIVMPDNAYFGRKDAQQTIILKKMVLDLNLEITVRTLPIIRDGDGLALSSRNVYLSEEQRQAALYLPGALQKAREDIAEGLRNVSQIKERIE